MYIGYPRFMHLRQTTEVVFPSGRLRCGNGARLQTNGRCMRCRPKSKEILENMAGDTVKELKFFQHMDMEIRGIPSIVNRGGFTGEKWGYEIYVNSQDRDALEEILKTEAEKAGGKEVTEFQVMAWTLPTEANFLLYERFGTHQSSGSGA